MMGIISGVRQVFSGIGSVFGRGAESQSTSESKETKEEKEPAAEKPDPVIVGCFKELQAIREHIKHSFPSECAPKGGLGGVLDKVVECFTNLRCSTNESARPRSANAALQKHLKKNGGAGGGQAPMPGNHAEECMKHINHLDEILQKLEATKKQYEETQHPDLQHLVDAIDAVKNLKTQLYNLMSLYQSQLMHQQQDEEMGRGAEGALKHHPIPVEAQTAAVAA